MFDTGHQHKSKAHLVNFYDPFWLSFGSSEVLHRPCISFIPLSLSSCLAQYSRSTMAILKKHTLLIPLGRNVNMNLLNGKTSATKAKKKISADNETKAKDSRCSMCTVCAVRKRQIRRPKPIANKEKKIWTKWLLCVAFILLSAPYSSRCLGRFFRQIVTNKNNRCAPQSVKESERKENERRLSRAHTEKQKKNSTKNEWKNVFRIKVIKVNFYYMNIEYYILFHHQPHFQQHRISPMRQ